MKIIPITDELRKTYKNVSHHPGETSCKRTVNQKGIASWYCTRVKGHKCMRHVAHGGPTIFFIWED